MQDANTSRSTRCEAAVESFQKGSLTRIGVILELNKVFSEPVSSAPGLICTHSRQCRGNQGPVLGDVRPVGWGPRKRTVQLLGVYGVDPKRTLSSLPSRTRVEFPESQWLRLISLPACLVPIFSYNSRYSLHSTQRSALQKLRPLNFFKTSWSCGCNPAGIPEICCSL